MKKSVLLTLAALAIIFTQCKKAESVVPQGGTTQNGETIEISLNINKNSKVIVDPGSTVASITFQTGDVIHVASDGKYSGTLTCDGGIFKGTIVKPSKGSTMYFYFLGNKSATDADGNALSTTTGSESTTMMVNISEQSSALPVISYGTATYNETTTEYSATLRNQCGLVKFTTSDYTGNGTLSIKKMNNKVTVDLSNNSFTPGKVTDDGIITLNKASDGVYWAILLPQDAVEGSTKGDAFSSDSWTGIYGAVPAIAANSYVASGVAISNAAVTHEYVDLGLSVKWATCNVGAENPEDYGNYFAWGETTTKGTYSWTNYQWCNGSYNTLTKYCTNSDYGYSGFVDNKTVLEMSDDAARANWGGDWRMPTKTEMEELQNNCIWTRTTQNGKNGYRVTGPNGNSIFLPAAGYYNENSLYNAGYSGLYWSSSLSPDYPPSVYYLNFSFSSVDMGSSNRHYGRSVRPVCPSQK